MSSAELSWTESDAFVNQIAEYQIFRADKVGGAAIGPFALVGTNVVTRDEFGAITNPVSSLLFSDGTTDFVTEAYQYRIDAVPVFVGEAPSPQTPPGRSNILGLGTQPSAPVLSGVQNGDDIDLTWIASTPALNPIDLYTVFRSVNSGPFVVIGTTDESTLAFTDDDVDRDADNPSYKVTATDEVGIESEDSNIVEFAVLSPALVAVSLAGGGDEQVAVSFDAGRTWDINAAAENNSWRGVAYSESQQLLVAVSSTGTNRVMTSPNGVIWTPRSAAAALQWRDVAYSPDLDLFAAVADSGSGNRVMTSPDGIVWTTRTTDDEAWDVIRWIPFLGVFMAAAVVATTDCVMTSADGITWTRQTIGNGSISAMATSLSRVSLRSSASFFGLFTDDGVIFTETGAENSGVRAEAFGAGRFVVVGPGAANRQESTTGAGWNGITMPSNSYLSVIFYEDTQEFVALASSINSVTSDDGLSWVEHAGVLPSGTQWGAIVECRLPTDLIGQEMVMVEASGSAPVAGLSTDGINWDTNPTAFLFALDDVAWSSPLGLYVAVGDGVCITSPDGITWTPRTVTAQDWQTVYFSEGLALFLGGADEAGTNQIMTSPDGTTWTDRVTPNGYRCHDFVEHPTGNGGTLPRICAVGLSAFSNPTGNMQFSDDGITWSPSTTDPSNRVVACTYDSTLDRVVVIETGGQCNVSSDCDTYTLNINSADIGSGNAGNSSAMDYSAVLDQLVFVSSNGVFSSEDGGASWTLRNANDMQDVKYSTVLAKWIACNDADPRVLVSSDGITWTESFIDNETWVAIALGDEI